MTMEKRYIYLIESSMERDGKWRMCGYNLRHDCRYNGKTKKYEVIFYIPGYGVAKRGEYKTLSSAKAAMTKFDRDC